MKAVIGEYRDYYSMISPDLLVILDVFSARKTDEALQSCEWHDPNEDDYGA